MTDNERSSEKPNDLQPASPAEPFHLPPKPDWTEAEKWVWEQVCREETADFNDREGELDPEKPDGWSEKRLIRPAFLETVLLHDPFRSALGRKGVRISGAWIKEPIDLENARIGHEWHLEKSRFEAEVRLVRLEGTEDLSFVGSVFTCPVYFSRAKIQGCLNLSSAKCIDTLNMNGLAVESSLFMRNGAEFAEVNLVGARVNGQLDMTAGKFNGKLNMSSLVVESHLFMRNGAEFAEVDLGSAKVHGVLDMTAGKFNGNLNMNGLLVESSLFMSNGAEFAEVDLGSARVNGQLDMTAGKFTGNLNMNSLVVGSHLFIRRAVFDRSVSISFGNIGGNFDISEARVPSLDLTGAQVLGELRVNLGPVVVGESGDRSRLILRNTKVGAVQDGGENAWPEGQNSLDLSGFTYSRLGGQDVGGTIGGIESRKKGWFIEWLEKDGTFSPQPYHQLAEVMRQMGHAEEATEILYAGKERERRNAKGLNGLGLSLLKYLIGYGYGYRYFYSLIWVVLITLIGIWVFSTTKMGHSLEWGGKLAFSLDMLLPFIELDPEHSDTARALTDWQRYYFFGHKVFGFILGSFVVAGLSGITKK